ncbi:hypothetical protein [Legionella feeleii]|uniref:Uncharacterized protein n=1 Tax=Legionella feeleii TaxID=453 RepID=A0A2X1STD0_9GAMM|nr:hypothetical protein [Legionella feeleii]SPX59380.1 Uncharacterised protein [Legionella feeleii]
MDNFITGFFTLIAALGAIFLKDHLENRKHLKTSLKQKAIEAYSLADSRNFTLAEMRVLCGKLVNDKNYSYTNLPKESVLENLAKLEILIIENFYDLNPAFLNLNRIIITQYVFLSEIIVNNSVAESEFRKRENDYQSSLVEASLFLKNELIEKYINQKIRKIFLLPRKI